jgi:hypothetical protein
MQDVTKVDTMRELQGDKVLAVYEGESIVLTIIRVVEPTKSYLMLVDRTSKPPDEWPLDQQMADRLVPNKTPEAKWRLLL